MLPKINRLKKTKDIEGVFRAGKGCVEDFLFMKITKNGLGVSRFAFIVSKKNAKKSSARNRIKRILRAQVAARLPGIKTGFDAAIVVLRENREAGSQKTKETIEKLFKKAKLI